MQCTETVSHTHLDVYKRQVLYGAETQTLRKEDEKRLEAFEMWV